MKLAIVGINGRNLDKIDKLKAMKVISTIYNDKVKENKDPILLSFNNPRGGISALVDVFSLEFKAENKQYDLGKSMKEWKEAQTKIAEDCDQLYCLTTAVKDKPCYHCLTLDHERNGGCYAKKEAQRLGKKVKLIILWAGLVMNQETHLERR